MLYFLSANIGRNYFDVGQLIFKSGLYFAAGYTYAGTVTKQAGRKAGG